MLFRSYKSAWQAVETLTNLAGTPIVEKVVGGSNGGGTQLTATGRMILHQFRRITGYTLTHYIHLVRVRNCQFLLLNIKHTQLQDSFGVIMLALVDNHI